MPVSRRLMLKVAALVPIGAALTAAATAVGRVMDDLAASLRPTASGTSSSRCGQCGSPDHSMLDARCPSAPRVI